jgi:hypothetical protein
MEPTSRRKPLHEKMALCSEEARLNDTIVVWRSQSVIHGAHGDRKHVWVSVNRVERKHVQSLEDLDIVHGLKSEESEISGVDRGVQHQRQGTDMIQKEAASELDLQDGKYSTLIENSSFTRR